MTFYTKQLSLLRELQWNGFPSNMQLYVLYVHSLYLLVSTFWKTKLSEQISTGRSLYEYQRWTLTGDCKLPILRLKYWNSYLKKKEACNNTYDHFWHVSFTSWTQGTEWSQLKASKNKQTNKKKWSNRT